MRSTLFYIPHELFGLPVFGFGLLLGLVVIAYAGWAAWVYSKTQSTDDIMGSLPVVGIAAAVIIFLLPNVEQRLQDDTILGLPVRGYGVMVVAGLMCGVGITVARGRQLGMHPDTVIGLGFWMMFVGVLGARVFYVVQKWNEFSSWQDMLKLTEGGLVIYGGVMGGMVAGFVYCRRKNLKLLVMADLVAPGFLIGQSLGRIGCLLHGCCFGGVCEADLPAIQFPHGSGPYQAQLASGELLGIATEKSKLPARITKVASGSLAEERGIAAGSNLSAVFMSAVEKDKDSIPTAPDSLYSEVVVDGVRQNFLPSELPAKSLPTHPSQVYSAINAALLCLLIWFLQPFPARDGMVFCIAIICYTSSRFLMELVRSDEQGQLGTGLTIAQLLSIAAITSAVTGLLWLKNQPPNRDPAWRGHSAP
ncbi:MAG: prolipoprotein diacylglyceryl transferase family protein [Planctomycetota bacterium]